MAEGSEAAGQCFALYFQISYLYVSLH